jgi:hypothetical protein
VELGVVEVEVVNGKGLILSVTTGFTGLGVSF